MGATNALTERRRTPLRRATLNRMAEIYAQRFADRDGKIRATFEIIWLSGWAPHESQQKPLRPGSAQTRLADALGTRERSAGEKAGGEGAMSDPVLSHVSRASIFQREATWRLGADALEREGGEPAAAPWWAHAARYFLRAHLAVERHRGSIPAVRRDFPTRTSRELRLSFDPTRFDTRRHRCDIRMADGTARHALVYALRFRRGVRGSRRNLHAACSRTDRSRCRRQSALRFSRRQAAIDLLGRAGLSGGHGGSRGVGARAGRRLGLERNHLGKACARRWLHSARVALRAQESPAPLRTRRNSAGRSARRESTG